MITIIFIFHFIVVIPVFIIYELMNKRKIVLTLLIIFLLPVSLRFIIPKSMLIKYEWNRLYKASALVLKYKNYEKNWEYNWKDIKEVTLTDPPISWIDFKYYKIRENFDGSLSIYSSSFKVGQKWVFLEYSTKTDRFEIVNDETYK
ncbi:hypothetical protein J7L48_06130 [bacterium]|nr:hypothetical protein [bacterium]